MPRIVAQPPCVVRLSRADPQLITIVFRVQDKERVLDDSTRRPS